jgi:hypothetical protein
LDAIFSIGEEMLMKLYLAAVAIAVGSATLRINTCMFHASAKRLMPIHIAQFK